MPFIFRRPYRVVDAANANTGPLSTHETAVTTTTAAQPSLAQEGHMTTRVCHTWSYYDAGADETVWVVLHAHHSLHVDVAGASTPGTAPRDASPSSTAAGAASSLLLGSSDSSREGLCGYTWELTWLPSPSASSSPAAAVIADEVGRCTTPVRASFFLPRTRPLATSTLQGSGGVLFVSCRHVLIATESDSAACLRSTAPAVQLDSFLVLEAESGGAGTARHLWQREAATVLLPCKPLRASPPTASSPSSSSSPSSCFSVAPLLVCGVTFPPLSPRDGGTAPSLRVLYVAAVDVLDVFAAVTQDCVFVGVADLFSSTPTSAAAAAAAAGALICLPRHATTVPVVSLSLAQPSRTPSTTASSASTAAAAAIIEAGPRDVLWVYVADEDRNRDEAPRSTQLYGSLVAVLPCLPESGTASSAIGGAAALPFVVCTGFGAASKYGALGVASDALNAVAVHAARQQRRGSVGVVGRPSIEASEEVLAQLLPAAERAVYMVELRQPAEHLSSNLSQLPANASVLIFVCDGVCARGATRPEQGFYTTLTPSWRAVATAAGGPTHRVPLSRTLWCGLTPVVPSSAGQLSRASTGPTVSAAATAEGSDMWSWGLTDTGRWSALLAGRTHTFAPTFNSAGEEEGEGGEPFTSAATHTQTITTTAVPFFSSAAATATTIVARCLPTTHVLAQELTVWYVVHDDLPASPTAAAAEPATAAVASLPPACDAEEGTTRDEWEAQVAEWVVARHLLCPTPTTDTAALTATYAALKLLWAYVVQHTHPTAGEQPAWVPVLMHVLRSTVTEAALPSTQLYVYARAVSSLVCAGLAACSDAEAEMAHLRSSAKMFFRLVLRVLTELDWRTGCARGRQCGYWMARWFLGEAVMGSSASTSDSDGAAAVCASQEEGLAMQVMLQLDASAPVLAWLRRMVLLYTCRNNFRPLELTLADIVEASGVWLDDAAVEVQRREADMVEWRASMTYALLRLVQPHAFHRIVHCLSRASGPQRTTNSAVVLQGLLSVADLHALVCVGWSAAEVQEAAPLGFSFVCLLVDVALHSTASPANMDLHLGAHTMATAEAFEGMAVARLEAWEAGSCETTTSVLSGAGGGGGGGGEERVPVYPLLALLTEAPLPAEESGGVRAAATPFPFSTLPPLLTVYLWYHSVNRLCTALQLLPKQASTSGVVNYGEDVESASWWRRGRSEAAVLCDVHRATCVLRSLTQDTPRSAEELFAAVRLVVTSDASDYGSHSSSSDRDAAEYNTAASSGGPLAWGVSHLLSWRQLLPLTAPPLSTQSVVRAYQEQCQATRPHIAYLTRVLHLVYASAGEGHLLRAQLWRATVGDGSGASSATAAHARSVHQIEDALEAWMTYTPASGSNSSAPASPPKTPSAAATVSSWLVQVWVHVLVCDPVAITDVGLYEQLYTALTHIRQRTTSSSSKTATPCSPRGGADVAFALLRPCLMFAYPLLRHLAVTEEVLKQDHAAALPQWPQFNEPLVWSSDSAGEPRSERVGEREHLCAGEVCECVRRQLSRITALYEAPMPSSNYGSSGNSGSGGDVRFRVLGLLLSLLPPAADVAHRQEKLARCSIITTSNSAVTSSRATPAAQDKCGSRHRSNSASSYDDDGDFDDEDEAALELTHFYISPSAAYVTAASALAISSSSSSAPACTSSPAPVSPQSPSAQASRHLSWFTVVCEVLRRELRAGLMAELVMAGCARKVEEEPPGAHVAGAAAMVWHLVASEKELKAFINALADAVEPLTEALVEGFVSPRFQTLLLLLVFETLHTLLVGEEETSAVAAATSAPAIRAEDQMLRLLQQWIRQVVTPLHRSLGPEDRAVVSHVVTAAFAQTYLETPEPAGQSKHSENVPTLVRYADSDVHQRWQRWRRHDGGAAAPWSILDDTVMSCLEGCVAVQQRHVLHLTPPFATPAAASAPLSAVPKESAALSLGGQAVSWREAGSALRSSLIQSIGATVAPRSGGGGVRPDATSSTTTAPQPVVIEVGERIGKAATPQPPFEAPRSHADQGTTTTIASSVAATRPASRDFMEAVQLLSKEEDFLRRRITQTLLAAQQRDVFASPPFQRALSDLYVAMRAEKRRKELVAFAVDQHDLIFAFVSREQQMTFEETRRALRQAWVDYGERQRLAVRRLLQAERDARMGVEAVAGADRAALRAWEQGGYKLLVLQSEGRLGLQLMEQDAWDALDVAAAEARVALARQAVEAEEDAYWKAEDAAWRKMEGGEGEEVAPQFRSSALPPPPPLPSSSSVGLQQTVNATRPPAVVHAENTVVSPPPPPPAAQKRDTGPLATSSLFGTLSRWQTALRETVAPAPPAKTAAVSAASPALPTRVSKTAEVQREEEEEVDNWGWDSAGDSKDTKQLPVVPLPARRLMPLVRVQHPISQPRTAAAAAMVPLVPAVTAAKPAKARKGLAAAVLVEPVSRSSAAAAAAAPVSPPAVKESLRVAPPCPDDSTPNPVRSILSAVEAAAAETISKVHAAPAQPPSPTTTTTTTTPTRRSTTKEDIEGVSSQLAIVTVTPLMQPPLHSSAPPESVAVSREAQGSDEEDDDGWGWSDEDDTAPTLSVPVSALPPLPEAAAEADEWGWGEDGVGLVGDFREGDNSRVSNAAAAAAQEKAAGFLASPPLPSAAASGGHSEPAIANTPDRVITGASALEEETTTSAPVFPQLKHRQQQQALALVAEKNAEGNDAGWGWSEDDEDVAPAAEAVALPVLDEQVADADGDPTVVLPPAIDSAEQPADHADTAPVSAAAAADVGGIAVDEPPCDSVHSRAIEAPAVNTPAEPNPDRSSSEEDDSFGSDVVLQRTGATAAPPAAITPPATSALTNITPLESVLPRRPFASVSGRVELRLQQLYLTELKMREEMLNLL